MLRRTLMVSCVALIVLFPAKGDLLTAGSGTQYRIAGAGRNEKNKVVPVDVLSSVQGDTRVSIRYLTPEEADAALATVVGDAGPLFKPRTETSRGHLVFALQIENQGKADVIYEPGQGQLVTDRSDAEFPLDYTGLYRLLSRLPDGAPSLEDVERAVYGRAVSIAPGGSVRKLLVFDGPRDAKFKKFEVRIGAIEFGEGEIDARFPFRRFKVKP